MTQDGQQIWAHNEPNSYVGGEAEGGLMIRAGFLNLMGGASSVQLKYTDYYLGIGLDF
jgi:hypothetical protein